MTFLIWVLLKAWFRNRAEHILVVFQNNNELRGGGGFITQLLDVELGKRKAKLHFRHDHNELRGHTQVTPPKEVQEFLKLKHWFFRDSNLFGNFEKSAKRMIESYCAIYPKTQVSGVVAINYSLLEQFMKVVGSIKEGTIVFTAKNLFYQLSTLVSDVDFHNAEEGSNRKWILKALFKKIMKTIIIHVWKWPRCIALLKKAIVTKDLQLFTTDQYLQNKFIVKGLVMPFTATGCSDALAVIENNYLGLKTNRYLRRTISREVSFAFDKENKKLAGADVTLTIEVQHGGGYDYPISGTYQGVMSTCLLKSTLQVKVMSDGKELEAAEEGDFITRPIHYQLAVGKKFLVTIHYQIPAANLRDDHYSFKYIKQSGVVHEHVHEILKFPESYNLETKTTDKAEEIAITDSSCFVDNVNVKKDYQYEVIATLNHNPPRIFYHEIVAPQIIDIRFNEVVTFSGDALQSIQVIAKDSGKIYVPQKYEFRNNGKWLYIYMKDLPELPEKFYQVKLAHLCNDAGIPLPESREITVVYRPKYFHKIN